MDKYLRVIFNMAGEHPEVMCFPDCYSALTGYSLKTDYRKILEQQLRLIPNYMPQHYIPIRNYISDTLTALLSSYPDDFIEGDLGEVKESFMSLDRML